MRALVAVPIVYFVVAWLAYPPFARQGKLTMSRSAHAFDRHVEASGAISRTRKGLLVDLGFIAAVAVTVPALLAAERGLWWVPLAAVALDLAEDAVVVAILAFGATTRRVTAMRWLATAKYVAYLATAAAVVTA